MNNSPDNQFQLLMHFIVFYIEKKQQANFVNTFLYGHKNKMNTLMVTILPLYSSNNDIPNFSHYGRKTNLLLSHNQQRQYLPIQELLFSNQSKWNFSQTNEWLRLYYIVIYSWLFYLLSRVLSTISSTSTEQIYSISGICQWNTKSGCNWKYSVTNYICSS
jgi:hypothetical protein